MEDVKYMVLRDYYALLDEILKENDKQTKKTGGNAGKT